MENTKNTNVNTEDIYVTDKDGMVWSLAFYEKYIANNEN